MEKCVSNFQRVFARRWKWRTFAQKLPLSAWTLYCYLGRFWQPNNYFSRSSLRIQSLCFSYLRRMLLRLFTIPNLETRHFYCNTGRSILSWTSFCRHQIESFAKELSPHTRAQLLTHCQQNVVQDQMDHPIQFWKCFWILGSVLLYYLGPPLVLCLPAPLLPGLPNLWV